MIRNLLGASLLFAVSLRAQDTAGVFPVRTIYVNPLSLISPYEPSLRIGYEQFITPRASILIEAGGYPSFNVEGWMDGILGRVEVCYWYRTNKNGKWSGVSLGIAYKAMHGTFQDSIAIGNMPPYMRSYEVEKDVLLVRLLRVIASLQYVGGDWSRTTGSGCDQECCGLWHHRRRTGAPQVFGL
ncbi:MAG: hypothetical protein IPI55_06260 [Flavobacteriales bacterium]|nr:hypothetical protein [Flavobacteriales bacterium]